MLNIVNVIWMQNWEISGADDILEKNTKYQNMNGVEAGMVWMVDICEDI